METTIPFAGFYSSIHDEELDRALESIFSNSRGDVIPSLKDKAFDLVDWSECHLAYAEKYTECFADKFNLSLKFKMLCSPKYYNFETDRIICSIELAEVTRIFQSLENFDVLRQHIKGRFTSYDGFISHYPNKLEDWPIELENWDHNQVGTLIEAYVIEKHGSRLGQYDEYTLMGDTYEHAYNIVSNNIKDGTRLFKIADYLRTREERQYA
jgi:hypothetical protein